MERLHNVKYVKSVVDYNGIGESVAEVAFVGRSNVGKSSIINAVSGQKHLVYTSKRPGKTRTINVFDAGRFKWLVDLPGYGFATGPLKELKKWKGMIEGYLKVRPSLRVVYMIVDTKVGATALDLQMAAWLQLNAIPYTIIANKTDKLTAEGLAEQKIAIAQKLDRVPENILWTSARAMTGIRELVQDIARHLEL